MKTIYSLVFLLSSFALFSQSIQSADSLFQSGQFTQANEVYESIYSDGNASPSMLLKMAFIQEGLENYASALFYLNQYYSMTANRKVLDKMRGIAEEKDLRGYEYSDMEFFRNIILRFKNLILSALSGISLGLLGYIFYLKRKNSLNYQPLVGQVVLVVFMILVTNNFFTKPKAIIGQNQTLLMSGPSGGAEPIDVLEKGHKVSVLQESEAWVKISWANNEGYVRKNRLMAI